MTALPVAGEAARPFEVVRLDGERITDATLRGTTTLLVFLRHLY